LHLLNHPEKKEKEKKMNLVAQKGDNMIKRVSHKSMALVLKLASPGLMCLYCSTSFSMLSACF